MCIGSVIGCLCVVGRKLAGHFVTHGAAKITPSRSSTINEGSIVYKGCLASHKLDEKVVVVVIVRIYFMQLVSPEFALLM